MPLRRARFTAPVKLAAGEARKRRRNREHQEQAALFTWARLARARIPALLNLYAVPNGGSGQASEIGRMWMHAEGLEPGVWDVALDWPAGVWHGLRIEMKAPGEGLTPKQGVWEKRYQLAGYKTAVCHGWFEARAAICAYLGERE